MKRIIVLLMLCYACAASAQQEIYLSSGKSVKSYNRKKKEEAKGFHKENLIWGGGFGINVGNITAISVAPVVGYKFSEHFAAGLGFGYQYIKIKDAGYYPDSGQNVYYDYKANVFSAGVWARYLIIPNLFVHAEYEHDFFTLKDYDWDPANTGRVIPITTKYNVPCLLLGPGYRQQVSDNASLVLMGLYDVLQQPRSPYFGRIEWRIAFNVGF